jgi:hypothetical protein
VALNKGNSKAMADAIHCILYHVFHGHSKCDRWCGYLQDQVNYDHKNSSWRFYWSWKFKCHHSK